METFNGSRTKYLMNYYIIKSSHNNCNSEIQLLQLVGSRAAAVRGWVVSDESIIKSEITIKN